MLNRKFLATDQCGLHLKKRATTNIMYVGVNSRNDKIRQYSKYFVGGIRTTDLWHWKRSLFATALWGEVFNWGWSILFTSGQYYNLVTVVATIIIPIS